MSSSALPLSCHTGGIFETNGWLLHAPGGVIAVDAPAGFAEFISAAGAQIGTLLLTHAHIDHVEDAAAIAAEHGCPVIAWQQSTPELRLEPQLREWTGMDLRAEPYTVTTELHSAHTGEIEVCGEKFRYAHLPGHSPDSVVFHLPERNLSFSGDTLMAGGCGRSDFPGGSERQLLIGIRREFSNLPPDCLILSGHGPRTTVARELATNPVMNSRG